MKRSLVPRLYRTQDICLFCALRNGVASTSRKRRIPFQTRSYRSSASTSRPAGTAAAFRDDEDDELWHSGVANSRQEQNIRQIQETRQPQSSTNLPRKWRCGCGHLNAESRKQCTLCEKPKPTSAQYVTQPQNPAPEAARSIPIPSLQARPAPKPSAGLRNMQQAGDRDILSGIRDTRSKSAAPGSAWGGPFRESAQGRDAIADALLSSRGSSAVAHSRSRQTAAEEQVYLGVAEDPRGTRSFPIRKHASIGEARPVQDHADTSSVPSDRSRLGTGDRGLANRFSASSIRHRDGSQHSREPPRSETARQRAIDSPLSRGQGTSHASTFDSRRGHSSAETSPASYDTWRFKPEKSSDPIDMPQANMNGFGDTTETKDVGFRIRHTKVGSADLGEEETAWSRPRIPDTNDSATAPTERWRILSSDRPRHNFKSAGYTHEATVDTQETPRSSPFASKSQSNEPYQWKPISVEQASSSSVRANSDVATNTASQQLAEDRIYVAPVSEQGDIEDSRQRTQRTKSRRRADLFEISGEEPTYTEEEHQYSRRRSAEQRHAKPSTPSTDLDQLEEELYGNNKKRRKAKVVPAEVSRPQLRLPQYVSVQNLAQSLGIKLNDLIQKLEEEGFEGARHDHILDSETSAMFADIYGYDFVTAVPDSFKDLVARPPPEDVSALPPRPPIVTIMGHVDHGKTTILDWLRKASVAATEHGGITQHIGAFSVTMPGSERQITFLDTPGHAAFLDMRRRGANVTDIVVLVVAADDSVKPQTIEAINHALDAQVQIIVAINKVDKEDANVERVKQDLSHHKIVVEDYQGDYQAISVSGKTGQGMEELEEAILTLADISDFRAETDGPVEGWVLESKVTISGRVATVLVRRGTLRPGDIIVAGTTWARVRSLRNDAGVMVDEALPGTPVQVDGWRGSDPGAGAEVLQAEGEDQAKDVLDIRLENLEAVKASTDMAAVNVARAEEAEARAKVREWEIEQGFNRRGRQPNELEGFVEKTNTNGPKQVHFVIKADVAGSVEALVAAVSAIGNHEVSANVVHSGIGELTESDIKHLAGTGETGYAISFNQPIDISIRRLAEAAELPILDHNIIYKLTDDVKEKMSKELPPLITQRVLGEADIGQVFEITVKKDKMKIAGCRVTNGTISRSQKIRVSRNGEVIYTGTLGSLKNVKKDVTEMRKGSECGMGFENWTDFEVGDQVQCFEELEEKRQLY